MTENMAPKADSTNLKQLSLAHCPKTTLIPQILQS